MLPSQAWSKESLWNGRARVSDTLPTKTRRLSRRSSHHSSRVATEWLKTQFKCGRVARSFMQFLEGSAHNVV
ncbi:hypothetical protein PISMIDRAFT_678979 [Pisolithus microcarpus 441]|uniref:Uncharacterized protein n=1 Tax=Pisolithus microcarpus 441 TaxID=765257 RepID=A0A0C9ZMX3_9AGAM|nr:hypothetical protein PISMIDRAFT_678979 [Pisolithus microcarpus 441]